MDICKKCGQEGSVFGDGVCILCRRGGAGGICKEIRGIDITSTRVIRSDTYGRYLLEKAPIRF